MIADVLHWHLPKNNNNNNNNSNNNTEQMYLKHYRLTVSVAAALSCHGIS